jgi:hypothetical protein
MAAVRISAAIPTPNPIIANLPAKEEKLALSDDLKYRRAK